ncbi:hypothetical protein BDZ45DRAFT_728534 [Acephala macrosclerotiorum]|nr:hypothetical protein BDZ45DRAFT_728534 [Acephala macrosclerotiorum]
MACVLYSAAKGILRKSKAQDSSPKYGAVSLTNPTQDAVLRPSELAGPSTITVPPAPPPISKSSALLPAGIRTPLDTISNTSLNNTGVETVAVISQTAIVDQAANITNDSAEDYSLWDIAYDTLKKEKPDRIAAYEDLLSRVPTRTQAKSTASHETEDAGKVTNQIPQHDAIARREKLKQITELGPKHMEDRKISATLLGHEIILQDVVANVAGAVEWTEDYVRDAVKDLPYASIAVAGVSLVLPLLKNPSAAEAANQNGFTYVTSQMRYYNAMESLLLPEDMKSDLRADLKACLVAFYKLVIDFQVHTVLRFYRSRTKNFFRGTIKYDGWDRKLQDIKDGDKEIVLKFETAMSATSLDVLKNLAEEAEASRTALYSLLIKQQELVEVNRDQLSVAQDSLRFAKKMDRVVACKPCQYALVPEEIAAHLRSHHRTSLKSRHITTFAEQQEPLTDAPKTAPEHYQELDRG